MEAKHPQQRQSDMEAYKGLLRRIDRGAAAKADAALVSKCLGSFPADSAPGASGLRPSHLKAACDPEHRDSVIRELVKVINTMLAGTAPSEVQPWLMGGNLTVLTKPGGSGHRPIAVGETLRRLCCKVVFASAVEDVQDCDLFSLGWVSVEPARE
eukprot:5121267-Amphidinium_carterae.1